MNNEAHFNNDSIIISIRMSKQQFEELQAIIKQLNTNRNSLINKAVTHYLAMFKEFNYNK